MKGDLDWALMYAQTYGWPVFPCHSPTISADGTATCSCGVRDCGNIGKHPRTFNGFHDATTDEKVIRAWWKKWPDANIGIPTGAISGIIVMDVDAVDGWNEITTHGGTPETYTVSTGKDAGAHLYFQHPGFPVINRSKVLPGLDSRGDGGYVIAPPSLHETGKFYSVKDTNLRPTSCPEWWLELVKKTEQQQHEQPPVSTPHLNGHGPVPVLSNSAYVAVALQSELDSVRSAPVGTRNHQLNTSAFKLGTLVGAGELDEEVMIAELTNAGLAVGLKATEIKATIKSGLKKGKEKPREIPALNPVPMLRKGQARAYLEGKSEKEAAEEDEDGDTDLEDDDDDPDAESNQYALRRGRTYHVIEKTNNAGQTVESMVPVCDLGGHIVEEIRDEAGAAIYKIQGKTRQRLKFDLEIEALAFHDSKQLIPKLGNIAGASCVFFAGQEKHVGPSIKSFTKGRLHSRRFNRVGWCGDEFIIPGREAPNTTIILAHKHPYFIDPGADLTTGLECLRSLLLAQTVTATTVAAVAAFQAPMALGCGWRDERYGVFINGRTNSFKSAWAVVLMCLYGPDFQNEDRLVRFGHGATLNMMMNHLVGANDMPLLVDNYKPSTGGGSRDLINLIHSVMEGSEKDRMNRDGVPRPSRPIHAWPFFTGEDVPDSDAAALARLLIVPFSWKSGADNPSLTAAQTSARHLCAVGGAWLDWLTSEDGKQVMANTRSKFFDRRSQWMAALRDRQPDMVGIQRVASNLATNELTWEAMEQCPTLQPVLSEFESSYRLGLASVAGGMAVQTVSSLEANRYLNALRDMLAARRVGLVSVGHDMPSDTSIRNIGWQDDDGVYLIPEVAFAEVAAFLRDSGGLGGIGKNTIHKQLRDADALESVSKDGIPIKKRCGSPNENKPQWVLHVKKRFLIEPGDAE